jgi:ABC-type transport system involved in multi-copper enzyme maturation permease subunit
MLKEFLRLELKQTFKQPMVYIFILINFLMIFGAATSDQITIGGSVGNIHKNAPYIVLFWLSFMSFFFGLLSTTAFMNNAALRDYNYQFHQILFSSPIKKGGYFWGRFLGGYIGAMTPALGVFLAIFLAPYMPWVDAERYGPFPMNALWSGIVVYIIPNFFFCAAILYGVASWSKSTITSFVAAVVLLVAYGVALNLVSDLEDEQLGMLLDPFAINTTTIVSKYWTVQEKNTLAVGLSGLVLVNRLIWMSVAAVVLLLSYWRFSFQEKSRAGKVSKKGKSAESEQVLPTFGNVFPKTSHRYNFSANLRQFANQVKVDFLGVVRSVPFVVIMLLGAFNMGFALANAEEAYGVTQLPVTYNIIDLIRGTFSFFIFAIITFYSGTIVWKERDAKMNDLYDSLPFPGWITYLSKYFTVVGLVAVILTVATAAGVLAQAAKGYYNFQLEVYFWSFLVLDLLSFAFFTAAAMVIHTLVNQKYLGYFVFIVFLILNEFVWNVFKIDSNLVVFGSVPSYTYSDMSKWGPYIGGLTWFNTYWALFCALLSVLGVLFWVRGHVGSFKERLTEAGLRLRQPAMRGVLASLLLVWIATAGFVFYNAEVLNPHKHSERLLDLQAAYEKQYKKYEHKAQPRMTNLKYFIDIYPNERDVKARAEITMANKSTQPIDSVHFTLTGSTNGFKKQVFIPGAKLVFDDKKLSYQIYRLAKPLAPGDSIKFQIKSDYISKGFENEVSFNEVVQNGSFFNNNDLLPLIGYQPDGELSEKKDRKKRGLNPNRKRMAPLQAPCGSACENTYLSNFSDWVNVETVISTVPDQIAVAPGSLLKEWQKDGRRYFQYRLDHPSWNFYSFISARYEVKREKWQGRNLEVYYQKGHEYNVPKMMKSIRKSLEYYTANFAPYWHQQARIIEFPRYASFAQAFPGTMPYSEGIGFISDLKDPEDIDMVYYVVAHEMGHQWWAHEVCGGNVQGATMLSETFAQYSALMVMEKEYGREQMKKFLKYEMDRYLRGRGTESQKETPLMKGENQGYIHYRKGSVVMYAIRDFIGDTAVNAAMKSFLRDWAYKPAPYPTTLDYMPYLAAHTPDSLKYLLKDLFEDITLYSNRTISAKSKDLGKGKYEITLNVSVEKFKSDSLGREIQVPLKGDYLDIGVMGEAPKGKKEGSLIYRARHRFTKKDNTFKIVVDKKPAKAGIDPYLLFVDRIPDDNMKKVEN